MPLAALLALATAIVPAQGGKFGDLTRVLELELERSTLQDVVKRLGPAQIRHNGGDAFGSASSVCYVGDDDTTLVFRSNSEMGGDAHDLTTLQLVERASLAEYTDDADASGGRPPLRPKCGRSPLVGRALALGGLIRLGMTRAAVVRRLGVIPKTHGNQLVAEEHLDVGDDFITSRTVEVTFEHDRVVAVSVTQMTSN